MARGWRASPPVPAMEKRAVSPTGSTSQVRTRTPLRGVAAPPVRREVKSATATAADLVTEDTRLATASGGPTRRVSQFLERRTPARLRATVTAHMRLLGLSGLVLALTACGGSKSELSPASKPDPKQLVVRLSDLPAQYSLVAGETRPTTTELILSDPWSTGLAAELQRQRVSGFKRAVWSPGGRRIECSLAVYRSVTASRRVFQVLGEHFRAFLARNHIGKQLRGGEDTGRSYRFDLGRLNGFAVSWRNRTILANCAVLGTGQVDRRELTEVVAAQRRRIATAMG